jgi:hypothetical protein
MVISGFAGMLGDAGVGPQHIMMLFDAGVGPQ